MSGRISMRVESGGWSTAHSEVRSLCSKVTGRERLNCFSVEAARGLCGVGHAAGESGGFPDSLYRR